MRELLNSIFAGIRPDTEVIVIDGASDDGTTELLEEWNEQVDYWISEPDTGIYNAMNKGLTAATGHYVLHLNAGDRLRCIPTDILHRCLREGVDVLCCRVRLDGSVTFKPTIGPRMRLENTWHHQGTFYQRLRHPGYDESYRIFADFDLNQRLLKNGISVQLCGEVVADHCNDGISVIGRERYSAELWRTVRRNSGLAYVPIAFAWYKLYFVRRRITALRRLLLPGDSGPEKRTPALEVCD